jgi:predicted ester cyclase
MTEENEALVKQYSETVHQRDWDALRDLMTPDFVSHEPPSVSEEPLDVEAMIETFEPFEWRFELKDIFSQGDKVATREVIYATQIDEFQSLPPSDKEMSTTSLLIWRIEDGKIAEAWPQMDTFGMLRQLGVVDEPGE